MIKRKIFFILLLAVFGSSGFSQSNQAIPTIGFDQLEMIMNSKNDTVIVINFWATWCAPCVEELPYFEEINQKYENESFKMYLVSLDFKRNKENRLIPFVEKHKLKAKVLHLFEPDANAWINKVDSSWSGAIPATLFIYNGRKHFHEGGLKTKDIQRIIQSLLT